jgi:hypothetical protein
MDLLERSGELRRKPLALAASIISGGKRPETSQPHSRGC